MGMGVDCLCNNCGYFDNFELGCGFLHFEEPVCYVPTPCFKCRTTFKRDIHQPQKMKCSKCRRKVEPYGYIGVEDDSSKEEDVVFSWVYHRETEQYYILKNKKYKCPQCGKDELEFSYNGTDWD